MQRHERAECESDRTRRVAGHWGIGRVVGRTRIGGRARRQWRSDGGAEVAGQNASRGSVSGRLADQAEERVLQTSLKDAEEEEGRKVQARACARTDSPGSRWGREEDKDTQGREDTGVALNKHGRRSAWCRAGPSSRRRFEHHSSCHVHLAVGLHGGRCFSRCTGGIYDH